MIEILKDMSASPCIKLCLASRPWNIYEDAFGQDNDRNLYLQHLTREDIALYARGKLEECIASASIEVHGNSCQDLILSIVDRAQGVVLWVSLVVRSLREGLINEGSIAILQERLRVLPTDLEPFFEHILRSVDSVYQVRMASTFQIALRVGKPLSLMVYSFLEEDPDFALKLPVHVFGEAEVQSRQKAMRRCLNGRYEGLLEATLLPIETKFFQYKVEFLHRTVRDFIMTPNIQEMLSARTTESRNAYESICAALLAQMKTSPTLILIDGPDPNLEETMNEIWYFAYQVENEVGTANILLLSELERTMQEREHRFLEKRNVKFLELAVQKGLTLYTQYRLDTKSFLIDGDEMPLLMRALLQPLNNGEVDLADMVGCFFNVALV